MLGPGGPKERGFALRYDGAMIKKSLSTALTAMLALLGPGAQSAAAAVSRSGVAVVSRAVPAGAVLAPSGIVTTGRVELAPAALPPRIDAAVRTVDSVSSFGAVDAVEGKEEPTALASAAGSLAEPGWFDGQAARSQGAADAVETRVGLTAPALALKPPVLGHKQAGYNLQPVALLPVMASAAMIMQYPPSQMLPLVFATSMVTALPAVMRMILQPSGQRLLYPALIAYAAAAAWTLQALAFPPFVTVLMAACALAAMLPINFSDDESMPRPPHSAADSQAVLSSLFMRSFYLKAATRHFARIDAAQAAGDPYNTTVIDGVKTADMEKRGKVRKALLPENLGYVRGLVLTTLNETIELAPADIGALRFDAGDVVFPDGKRIPAWTIGLMHLKR